jgi:hypothetical protein
MLNPFSGTTMVRPWGAVRPVILHQLGRLERIDHFDCYWQNDVCFPASAATPG